MVNRRTDGKTQTDRQAGRQTDRQTDIGRNHRLKAEVQKTGNPGIFGYDHCNAIMNKLILSKVNVNPENANKALQLALI